MRFVLPILFDSTNTRYFFINVHNMLERQQSSSKFMLHEHLIYDKQRLKMLPLHFECFHCLNFKTTFDKNVIKKATS